MPPRGFHQTSSHLFLLESLHSFCDACTKPNSEECINGGQPLAQGGLATNLGSGLVSEGLQDIPNYDQSQMEFMNEIMRRVCKHLLKMLLSGASRPILAPGYRPDLQDKQSGGDSAPQTFTSSPLQDIQN
jgi:hypothetical protein